jgi:hypothetical protein
MLMFTQCIFFKVKSSWLYFSHRCMMDFCELIYSSASYVRLHLISLITRPLKPIIAYLRFTFTSCNYTCIINTCRKPYLVCRSRRRTSQKTEWFRKSADTAAHIPGVCPQHTDTDCLASCKI